MLVANRTALVEQHYSNDMVAMGMQKRVLFKMQKQMVFEMQKKSPSEPRRDKSDDTAAHHAADAEDGDDEGPDEGHGGVAVDVVSIIILVQKDEGRIHDSISSISEGYASYMCVCNTL